ncbi:helix-turn-helix domain-containing protein [Sphingobacterium humi]|uniref:Helix-turn-helix domain-containing protein n=1 Tax=Sphingobacterium humi TaxID=1796905 RepID=A0A6N8L6E2_9SPHI|nr:helix-turn-helix transcriptional regulator [Sphingobacterium humi]MVZ63748.1 helix-turn-helix domain-containing protein [Sphingobacterium humi]
MNDLSHISSLSDAAIIRAIGEFIKAKRIDSNLTQDEVAEQAAVSRSTLSLMERGENTALINLLKVLRVLDALYVLNLFTVTEPISPLQLAKEDEKKRKRASRNNKPNDKAYTEW